jgi:glutamine synthetase type III
MTPKTMNEQMEEIDKKIKEAEEDYYAFNTADKLRARKSQLQTDMKIVEELKEKLKEEINKWIWNDNESALALKIIDKLFKEIVGR